MVEVNLANVAMYSGAPELAVRHARQALELSAQTGQRANAVEARHALVWAALRQDDLATARSELVASTTVTIAIGRTGAARPGRAPVRRVAGGARRARCGGARHGLRLATTGADRGRARRGRSADARLGCGVDGSKAGPARLWMNSRIASSPRPTQAYAPLITDLRGAADATPCRAPRPASRPDPAPIAEREERPRNAPLRTVRPFDTGTTMRHSTQPLYVVRDTPVVGNTATESFGRIARCTSPATPVLLAPARRSANEADIASRERSDASARRAQAANGFGDVALTRCRLTKASSQARHDTHDVRSW